MKFYYQYWGYLFLLFSNILKNFFFICVSLIGKDRMKLASDSMIRDYELLFETLSNHYDFL